MKALINSTSNEVSGSYTEPLNFSISDHYIIDIPDNLNVNLTSKPVANVITAKLNAYQTAHPSFTQAFNDEFLTTTGIDITLSNRVFFGPNKRIAMLPSGGTLMTNSFTITIPVLNKVIAHWDCFLRYRDPGTGTKPSPGRVLYNYDPSLPVPGFKIFAPSDILVSIYDVTGLIPISGPLGFDTEVTYPSATPLAVRLKFLNTHATRTHYMGDWIFMAG